LAVYNFKPTDYNEDLILKILDFTKTHGIVEATKEFDVSSAFILRWNKIYKIYEEKIYREFTEEQRKELLGKAKNIYDSLPEFNRSAALAFNDISQIYDINIGLLYNWNRNYRIVPTLKKSREKRKITQEEINAVKLALENSGGSKFAISRQTGISVGMIKRIFDEILQYDK
jgi:transposase